MIVAGILEDGVWFLGHESQNGLRLALSNGDWNQGRVQVRPANNTDHSNEFRDQRWLITKVPESDNPDGHYYHITNLFYGCQVGVYKNERSNSRWQVKAAPAYSGAHEIHWGFTDVGGGKYSIYWRKDTNRRLSQSDGKVLAWPSNHGIDQAWFLERDTHVDPPQKSLAQWMRHVPGDTELTNLNLVGTHQSLALHGWRRQGHEAQEEISHGKPFPICFDFADNPRCQNRSPYEQMLDGVRMFDCRFDVWDRDCSNQYEFCLYARHGVAKMGYSLCALLQCVQLFFQRFPSEMIVIGIAPAINPMQHWANPFPQTPEEHYVQAFRNDYGLFEKHFLSNNGKHHKFCDLRLDDVRGQAIVVGDETLKGVGEIYHRTSPGDFWGLGYSLDDYSVTWSTFVDHARKCRDHTQAAIDNGNNKMHTWSTAWNGSQLGALVNPIDAFLHCAADILNLYKPQIIGRNGEKRIGIVKLDFYEQIPQAVLAIVQSNRGCGSVVG